MTTDSVSGAMTTDKELDALVEHLRRSHDCGRSNGFRCSRCESADAISALRKERDDYKTWWERDSTSLGKALAEARHHRVIAQDFRALAATLREERDEALRELDEASPRQNCARCGKEFRWHRMIAEEGDEWECLPCNERENARERALAPQEPTTDAAIKEAGLQAPTPKDET